MFFRQVIIDEVTYVYNVMQKNEKLVIILSLWNDFCFVWKNFLSGKDQDTHLWTVPHLLQVTSTEKDWFNCFHFLQRNGLLKESTRACYQQLFINICGVITHSAGYSFTISLSIEAPAVSTLLLLEPGRRSFAVGRSCRTVFDVLHFSTGQTRNGPWSVNVRRRHGLLA